MIDIRKTEFVAYGLVRDLSLQNGEAGFDIILAGQGKNDLKEANLIHLVSNSVFKLPSSYFFGQEFQEKLLTKAMVDDARGA